MAVTRSLFRTIAVHRDRACEIVGALNRAVSGNNESNMFITLFLCILDLGTGRLVYCNAGHNPPVLSGRGEEPHFLACTSNIPIGVFGDFEYEEEYLDLGFERMLLLYTDGLTEAENRDSSLYSEARLLSTMQTLRGLSARETVETLEESVRTFAGGAEQSDDLTMLALGRLLPVRKSQEDALENVSDYTVELLVPTECPHVGKTVEEAGLYNVEGGHIIEIIRFDHEIISPVSKDEFIFGGDRLIFSGDVARILELKKTHQLVNATHHVFALNEVEGNRRLQMANVKFTSSLVGKKMRDTDFEESNDVVLVAVAREGERIQESPREVVLEKGDTLLLECSQSFLKRQDSYASELQLFDSENVPNIGRKTVLSALIMLAMILLSSFNVLPLMSSCFLAAFAMIITRCCSIKQARESIDWSILMIFAGSVCMGMAIERVGLAELLADNLLALAGNSPFWVLTCICVCGVVLSEFVSNTAAAAILYPVAYQTALVMDVNPLTFCIGLLISVSLCFASPIGSPTHMLVYGPGGYRFSDFMRVGIIMNVIMLIATLVFTPMIFPF